MQVSSRRTEHATRSVWRNAASPTMRSTVYKTVSRQSVRPSVCLSVPSMYSCNSVRRVCCCGLRGTAGGGDIVDRLLPGASAAFRSMSTAARRTAANASSVGLPAAVERWTHTRMIAAFVFRLDLQQSHYWEQFLVVSSRLPAQNIEKRLSQMLPSWKVDTTS